MERNIHLVNNILPPPECRRVGIYCRVSSNKSAQLHSLDVQASCLTQYVMNRPGWILTDIFLDVGSGGREYERAAFNRLLISIQNGTITTVITKSISRFGRDTETILTTVRMITALGANVYFEEQSLDTDDPQSELYITLYAGIAQAERQNIIENARWGVQKRLSNGTSLLFDRPCYGYTTGKDGKFKIVTSEAAVVRRIFVLYLAGNSVRRIKRILENGGIPSPTNKSVWSTGTIERILDNKKYCGYSGAGQGENYVELPDHHDAVIIPLEMFEMVQAERKARSNIEIGEDGIPRRKATRFTSTASQEKE